MWDFGSMGGNGSYHLLRILGLVRAVILRHRPDTQIRIRLFYVSGPRIFNKKINDWPSLLMGLSCMRNIYNIFYSNIVIVTYSMEIYSMEIYSIVTYSIEIYSIEIYSIDNVCWKQKQKYGKNTFSSGNQPQQERGTISVYSPRNLRHNSISLWRARSFLLDLWVGTDPTILFVSLAWLEL